MSVGLAASLNYETPSLDIRKEDYAYPEIEGAMNGVGYVFDQTLQDVVQNLTDLQPSNRQSIGPRAPPTPAPIVGGEFVKGVEGIELDASCSAKQIRDITEAWHNAYLMADEVAKISKQVSDRYKEAGKNDKDRNLWLLKIWPA